MTAPISNLSNKVTTVLTLTDAKTLQVGLSNTLPKVEEMYQTHRPHTTKQKMGYVDGTICSLEYIESIYRYPYSGRSITEGYWRKVNIPTLTKDAFEEDGITLKIVAIIN